MHPLEKYSTYGILLAAMTVLVSEPICEQFSLEASYSK